MPQSVTGVQKLKINRLTKTQFDGASPSNTEIYAVDPEFTGSKLLATDSNGDIIETTIDPAGVGTVTDVQVNGTTVTTSGVANIPMASNSTLGVVQTNGSYGIEISANGYIATIPAAEATLVAKLNGRNVVVANNLDIAVREGLGNNALTWTDAYKTSARNTIGAGAKTIIREWVG